MRWHVIAFTTVIGCGAVSPDATTHDAGPDARVDGGVTDAASDDATMPYGPWATVYGQGSGRSALATGPAGEIAHLGNGGPASFGGPIVSGPHVVKLDRSGQHVFTLAPSASLDAEWAPAGVSIDGAGTIHAVASFRGTLDFGGGPQHGDDDAIYVAVSASGKEIVRRFVGNANPRAFAISAKGDAFVAFQTRAGIVDFGDGPAVHSKNDVVLVKYKPTLAVAWTRLISELPANSSSLPALVDVALRASSAGGVVVAAAYVGVGTAYIDTVPYLPNTQRPSFVGVLDGNGATMFAHRFDGDVGPIATDATGNVFAIVAGFGVDFGDGLAYAVRVVKWSTDGSLAWSRKAFFSSNPLAIEASGGPDIDAFAMGNNITAIVPELPKAFVVRHRFGADGTDKGAVSVLDGKFANVDALSRDPFGSIVFTGMLYGQGDFGFGTLGLPNDLTSHPYIASLVR